MNKPLTNANDPRCKILAHAIELFRHYGYSKTSIGDIAQSCKMSPGNIYRFFTNKQELGLETVKSFFDRSENVMRCCACCKNTKPEERLRNTLRTGVDELLSEMDENPKLIEITDIVCNPHDGTSDVLRNHIACKIEMLTEIIQEGVETGDFNSKDPAADAACCLMATKACWDPNSIMVNGADQTRHILESQVDFALRAIKA